MLSNRFIQVIPLHLHSHWSLLDGVPSIQEIVAFAQTANLPALALTDSNALDGAMEFVAEGRKVGIAPIVGAELNVAGGHSIVLLAQNMQGYGNLCRLITRLQAAPDREASLVRGLALTDPTPHTQGLIALSGGYRGPLDAHLQQGDLVRAESAVHKLVDLFGQDRFVIELQIIQDDDVERARVLQALAERLHLRTVATHDVHYL